MSDYRLIKEFYQEFKGKLIDKNHAKHHHQLESPPKPKVLHINSRAVACVDLNKPRGSISGYVELYYLYVYPHQARKGYATHIMTFLCGLADKYNVEIELQIVPLKGLDTVIPQGNLYQFYKQFNFQLSSIRGSKLMTRKPNQ